MTLMPTIPWVKTFRARAVETRDGDTWNIDHARSGPTIDKQINEWIAKTGSKVLQTPAAPLVTLYADGPGQQTIITTISLLYVAATEGTNDPAS